MKIRKRRINSQDHTLGYLVGNSWRTRRETVQLAKQGRIDGVRVAGYGKTQHIRGIRPMKLYNLPTQAV